MACMKRWMDFAFEMWRIRFPHKNTHVQFSLLLDYVVRKIRREFPVSSTVYTFTLDCIRKA